MMQEDSKEKLPKGWISTSFDTVANVKNGFAFKSSSYVKTGIPLVRISNIQNQQVTFEEDVVFLPPKFLDSYNDFKILENDILITLSGATTGKYGIFNKNTDTLLNQRVGLIRSKDEEILSQKYLLYYFGSSQQLIFKKSYGMAQPNISTKFLKELLISIPPKNEQKRIVKKMDYLLSKLESIEKSLEYSKHHQELYKQSFFKSAFEGKLTKNIKPLETTKSLKEKFIDEHKKRNLNPKTPFEFETKFPILPKEWSYVSLDFISSTILSGGTPLRSIKTNFDEKGIPLLKVENINNNGEIVILNDQLRLSKTAHEKQSKTMIKENDVLFNIVGPPLGVIGFVTNEFENMNINQALVLVRTIQFFDPKLLFHCLRSPFYYNLMHKMGRGNRQDNIKKSDAQLIPIPLIPINHQKVILEKIDIFFKQHKIIQKNIQSLFDDVKELKLSILKQAITGKLVFQDPKDVPVTIKL